MLTPAEKESSLAPLPMIYADLVLSGKARAQTLATQLLNQHAQPTGE